MSRGRAKLVSDRSEDIRFPQESLLDDGRRRVLSDQDLDDGRRVRFQVDGLEYRRGGASRHLNLELEAAAKKGACNDGVAWIGDGRPGGGDGLAAQCRQLVSWDAYRE